jgi:hypothetical protein
MTSHTFQDMYVVPGIASLEDACRTLQRYHYMAITGYSNYLLALHPRMSRYALYEKKHHYVFQSPELALVCSTTCQAKVKRGAKSRQCTQPPNVHGFCKQHSNHRCKRVSIDDDIAREQTRRAIANYIKHIATDYIFPAILGEVSGPEALNRYISRAVSTYCDFLAADSKLCICPQVLEESKLRFLKAYKEPQAHVGTCRKLAHGKQPCKRKPLWHGYCKFHESLYTRDEMDKDVRKQSNP